MSEKTNGKFIQTVVGRYCAAVLAVAAGALLRFAISGLLGDRVPYTTFYPAVMGAALVGGFWPGALSVLLSVALVDYWLLYPPHGLAIGSVAEAVSVALFVVTGLLISVLAEVYNRAQRQAARYDTEAAVREQGLRMRRFYESGLVGVMYWSVDGGITDANDRLLETIGYTREDLEAGRIDWNNITPREYRHLDERSLEELKTAGVNEKPLEKEYIRKDGSRVPVIIAGAMLDDSRDMGVAFVLDITDRRNAEDALIVERQLLAAVVNNIPSQINLMRGSDFRIMLVNPAYQAVAPGKEMVGKTLNEVWPETGRDFVEKCREVLRTGEPYEAVDDLVEISREPGGPTEKRYFSWMLIPVDLPGGEGKGILSVALETTGRKQAEEEAAAAQRQVQSIIDNTTSIVYALDLEERFLLSNTTLAELLNSTPEQMIGKRRHEFMPKEDADWHEANDRKAIESGKALEFEEHSEFPGRSITWLTTKFPLRDAQGRIYAVAGISTDITERKHIEEAQARAAYARELIEVSVDPLVTIGSDGRITDVNKATEKVTGVTRDRLIGSDFSSYFTDPDRAREGYETVFSKGLVQDYALAIRHTSGRVTEVVYNAAVYRDQAGQVVGVFAAARDVTARKKVEELERQHELDAHKREFYRRMILAATEGKLLISERDEILRLAGPPQAELSIGTKEEASVATRAVHKLALDAGMDEDRGYEFRGCVTEAVTNAIKHANGGAMSFHRVDQTLFCVISDSGPGIQSMALPDVALTKNYSTAGTLGMGYKVMIHFADRIYLATGPDGTTVGIEMGLKPPESGPANIGAAIGDSAASPE